MTLRLPDQPVSLWGQDDESGRGPSEISNQEGSESGRESIQRSTRPLVSRYMGVVLLIRSIAIDTRHEKVMESGGKDVKEQDDGV